MSGQSGTWLTNVTGDIVQLFEDIDRANNTCKYAAYVRIDVHNHTEIKGAFEACNSKYKKNLCLSRPWLDNFFSFRLLVLLNLSGMPFPRDESTNMIPQKCLQFI